MKSALKVLINTSTFSQLDHPKLQVLREKGIGVVLNPKRRRLTEDEVEALCDETVIGMIAGLEPLTERVLSNAPNLAIISRCGIATENVDLAAAKIKKIKVRNTPDAPSLAVAELTIGLLLSLLRRIPEADSLLKQKQWQPLMGSLLNNKMVGVVGYGRVGRKVATLLQAFGAKVLVYDAQPIETSGDIEVGSFQDILSNSDIVTLHIPATPETKGLISKAVIKQMKPGSIIINTARGELVDEDAMYQALKDGHLAGAALDAYTVEPYNGPLQEMKNVVMTAHMGSYAKEARMQMEAEAVDNLVETLMQAGLVECEEIV
jgi:D-3-phosphoglycerate dehydrogenase